MAQCELFFTVPNKNNLTYLLTLLTRTHVTVVHDLCVVAAMSCPAPSSDATVTVHSEVCSDSKQLN